MKPILFEFGPFVIRFYGLMYAFALLLGLKITISEFKRKKLIADEDTITNLVMGIFLFGILGARIYYVLFNLNYYLANPGEIIAIWHGGLAIHGAIIGGFISGYFFTSKYKLPYWKVADIGSLVLISGQTIGRWGNFFNGDAHGLPTKLPWGVIFPLGTPAGNEFPGIPTHPTMIYESLLNFIAFLILFRLRKAGLKDGVLFSLYLIFYSTIRFFVSFVRADSLMFGNYKAAQLISIFGLILGSALIYYFNRKVKVSV